MAVSFVRRPINTGCKFNTVLTPVVYVLRREDAGITQLNNSGGFAQLQFNGIDLTAYFQVGNVVTMHKADATQNFRGTITASSFGGGNTLVTTDNTHASVTAHISGGSILNNLSKRTDYKIEIEVFRGFDDSTLNGVKYAYSCDPLTALIYFDIAPTLAHYVSADWVNNFFQCEFEKTVAISVYVKYNEYFDGAFAGVVSDVANPIQGVLGAMQIYHADTTYNHGANLLSYQGADSGRGILSRFLINSVRKKMRAWRGYPKTFCIIPPISPTFKFFKLSYQYDRAGVLLDPPGSQDELVNMAGTLAGVLNASEVKRVNIFPTNLDPLTERMMVYIIQAFENTVSGNDGVGSVSGNVNVNAALGSSRPAGTYRFETMFEVNPTGSLTANQRIITYAHRSSDGTKTVLKDEQFVLSGAATVRSSVRKTDAPFVIAHDFDQIRFEVFVGAGNYDWAYDVNTYTQIYREMEVFVEDPCINPFYIFWKGSTGGDEFFMFQIGQEISSNLQGGGRRKRVTMFAENLTLEEWEALNELNSPNLITKDNIIELSSAVIKTHTQLNQQAYKIQADAKKIGLLVIPTSNKTNTKNISHSFELTVDLPEAFY